MTQARILVVEDDNGLREALVDTLLLGGYECQQHLCRDLVSY